jgi:hypothetical protein
MHTSTKPYLRGEVADFAEALRDSNFALRKSAKQQLNYLLNETPEWLDSMAPTTRRPLFKVLYREPASFAHVESRKKGDYDLRFNPMISLQVGVAKESQAFIFDRTVGIEVRGTIKKVLSFYFNGTGNSAHLPEYVSNKSRQTFVPGGDTLLYMPGYAYYKPYSSAFFKYGGTTSADWFDARGYININVLNYVNITFGRDKHFWGNGIRSIFLSDNSAPMFFLKTKVTFWRIEYTSMLAELTSQFNNNPPRDFLRPKKYGAFHKLNFKVTHWLDLGIFEGVIAKRGNSFDIQYLNPLIFYRAAEHALGSPDNVFIGIDFKANVAHHASFYGQLLFDELNVKEFFSNKGWRGNKYGYQLGVKYIDLLPNLDAQLEWNLVRPFTYTHDGEINYTHYNQALAHPLGANFQELIGHIRYQPKPKWVLNARYIYARVGDDSTNTNGNYGGNIFNYGPATNEYGNSVGQGAKGTIHYLDVTATYQPWHNIYVDLELLYRTKSSQDVLLANKTIYIGAGLRINVAKRKYEF